MTAGRRSPTRSRSCAAAGLGCALALAFACAGDDGGSPDRLYLALLDSELTVQLVDHEPQPY